MEPRRRLIFRKHSKVEFGAVCMNNDWLLRARRPGDLEKEIPFELEYAAEDEDIKLVYLEDPIAECSYVVVSGAQMDHAREIIRKKLPIWSDDELLQDWRKAPHDTAQILAILRIGVGAPFRCDGRFAETLKEGLAHADSAVREASLAAVGYTEWPEFDQSLKDIAQNDSSERCRKRAVYMLQVRERERGARA